MDIQKMASVVANTGSNGHAGTSGVAEGSSQTAGQQQVKGHDSNPMDRQRVEKVVKNLNDMLGMTDTHFQFKYYEKLHRYYLQLTDENNQVVLEVPQKKILDIEAAMKDFVGLIINKQI